MNQEIKAKWVKALRSRKFKQGRGYLSKDGKYCCLGVLCELAVQEGVIDPPTKSPHGSGLQYCGHSTADTPLRVQAWAEMHAANPLVPDPERAYEMVTLAELNDGNDGMFGKRKPLGFRAIADLIEANL